MANKQTKIIASKGATPSPGQFLKTPGNKIPVPSSSSMPMEAQAPLPTQTSPEMHMIKELKEIMSTMGRKLEAVDKKLEGMSMLMERQGKELEQKLKEQSRELERKMEAQSKAVTEDLDQIKETIKINNKKMREDIEKNFKKVWEGVEKRMVEVENRIEGQMAEMKCEVQDQLTMMQYCQMMTAIRVRGLGEPTNEKQEDLKKNFVKALAQFLGEEAENISWQIDRIHRVNSWIAKNKNLPRDVVIHFVTKGFRDRISTTSYNKKLYVEGQEVMIFKEIPPKMLKERKDYKFLVTELKTRALQYRWEAPTGVSVLLKGKRYHLNSIRKAKEFLEEELKAGRPRPTTLDNVDWPRERGMDLEQRSNSPETQTAAAAGEEKGSSRDETALRTDVNKTMEAEQLKELRQTRATTKRIEQQEKIPQSNMNTNLDIMGARPKKKAGEKTEVVWQECPEADHDK